MTTKEKLQEKYSKQETTNTSNTRSDKDINWKRNGKIMADKSQD